MALIFCTNKTIMLCTQRQITKYHFCSSPFHLRSLPFCVCVCVNDRPVVSHFSHFIYAHYDYYLYAISNMCVCAVCAIIMDVNFDSFFFVKFFLLRGMEVNAHVTWKIFPINIECAQSGALLTHTFDCVEFNMVHAGFNGAHSNDLICIHRYTQPRNEQWIMLILNFMLHF